MDIALWIVQGVLALMFISAGAMKTFNSKKAKATMPWAQDSSTGFVVFVGLAELLGGIGLILPEALDVAPVLTPIAAIGLAVVMVLAAGHHAKRGEKQAVVMNVVLLALSLFVAIGRF
ncbi:DoxX family protein [Cohnella fermenti]|uniref:DoxX family protein n=1 Tax=Cohnella fermenti TaxID=2565925 RepID=A0A4S4BPP1_9BACL|nr:DoxX family protein [Cohnella fermenti]THF76355.1 DoxX family protein [Cohnella fermenti]